MGELQCVTGGRRLAGGDPGGALGRERDFQILSLTVKGWLSVPHPCLPPLW